MRQPEYDHVVIVCVHPIESTTPAAVIYSEQYWSPWLAAATVTKIAVVSVAGHHARDLNETKAWNLLITPKAAVIVELLTMYYLDMFRLNQISRVDNYLRSNFYGET